MINAYKKTKKTGGADPPLCLELKRNLKFDEDSGNIVFHYSRSSKNKGTCCLDETVPSSIAKKGEKEIFSYAYGKIKELERKIKRIDRIEENIRKNHIPIKTKYQNILLEGRIVEATSCYIGVELDKPLKGASCMNYGFASALAGHHVFTKDHKISEGGFDSACTALCWAYEDALHKPQKELAKNLNEKLSDCQDYSI